MLVVNPDYAYPSSVGPVFEVGTWVHRSWLSIGWLTCLTMAAGCATASAYAAFPGLFGDPGPQWLLGLKEGIEMGHQNYLWAMAGGALLGLIVSYGFLSMCISELTLHRQGEFFLRAGPGGISLRVPHGLQVLTMKHNVLTLDVPWEEIEDWKIIQHKQLGSLSPNAGNLHAEFQLALRDGEQWTFALSWFREPARIIWNKIQDAVRMVPMSFDAPNQPSGEMQVPSSTQKVAHQDRHLRVPSPEQFTEVETSLRRILERTEAYAIFSDAESDKFVQFCDVDGGLLLDLPHQTLQPDEHQRAVAYFKRVGLDVAMEEDAEPLESSSISSYQADLGDDASAAAQIVMDLFNEVYQLRSFEMEIVEEASYF